MLSEFDFKVVHKPGVANEMDCLSRFPQEDTRDSTGVRQEGDLEEAAVLAWSAASCLAWAGSGAQPPMGGAGLREAWEGPATLSPTVGMNQALVGAVTVDGRGSGDAGCPGGAAAAGDRRPGLTGRRQVVFNAGLGAGQAGGNDSTGRGGQAVSVATAPAQDVLQDTALLALLRGQGYPLGCSRRERDRLQHRARGFEWRGTHLVRRLVNGGVRVVPELAARGLLIQDVHERGGHVGVMKTRSLLAPHYWWLGLSADVARVVGGCSECDRVRAAFNAKHPTLQPLPIKGLFYRWGLDFAGPLPES